MSRKHLEPLFIQMKHSPASQPQPTMYTHPQNLYPLPKVYTALIPLPPPPIKSCFVENCLRRSLFLSHSPQPRPCLTHQLQLTFTPVQPSAWIPRGEKLPRGQPQSSQTKEAEQRRGSPYGGAGAAEQPRHGLGRPHSNGCPCRSRGTRRGLLDSKHQADAQQGERKRSLKREKRWREGTVRLMVRNKTAMKGRPGGSVQGNVTLRSVPRLEQGTGLCWKTGP